MSDKPRHEKDDDSFIIDKVPTGTASVGIRDLKGNYPEGLVYTLRAHPDNGAGLIYIGKSPSKCIWILSANQSWVTKIDLDKLYFGSTNQTETLLVVGEKE